MPGAARSNFGGARLRVILVLLGAYVACGPSRPPLANESGSGVPIPDGGTSFVSFDTAPACETLEDGGPCGCLELSFLSDVPNLYFVLDRSGSMRTDDKWQTVRKVVSSTLIKLGPRVRYGASTFPKFGTDCGPGIEVMPVRNGDSPAGKIGHSMDEFLTVTSVTASGGTPTAGTLVGLTPTLKGLGGRTFVILATDGGPNCNEQASCDEKECIANIEAAGPTCQPDTPPNCCTPGLYGPGQCLDASPTEAAVKALHDANIPTYVVGVPGSAPYAALLDRLAQAGGTARPTEPYYYRVDTTDSAALEEALRAIAAKVTARCDLTIEPAPPDPSKINVYFDDTVVPADPESGWRLDGNTVTLVGTSCDRVLSGQVLNVRVIAGCPTVSPR
jgi:hypothetical protein